MRSKTITRWALVCATTGKVIPEHRAGLTHLEPVHPTQDTGVQLYRTERGAKNAAAQWRRGPIHMETVGNGLDVELVQVVEPDPMRLPYDFQPVMIQFRVPIWRKE